MFKISEIFNDPTHKAALFVGGTGTGKSVAVSTYLNATCVQKETPDYDYVALVSSKKDVDPNLLRHVELDSIYQVKSVEELTNRLVDVKDEVHAQTFTDKVRTLVVIDDITAFDLSNPKSIRDLKAAIKDVLTWCTHLIVTTQKMPDYLSDDFYNLFDVRVCFKVFGPVTSERCIGSDIAFTKLNKPGEAFVVKKTKEGYTMPLMFKVDARGKTS